MMIALIIIAAFLLLLALIYFIEPFLYAFLFSKMIELFVKNTPYLEVGEIFPEVRILKENWKVIREELDEVLKNIEAIPKFHEVDKLQRLISAKDDIAWRTFIMKGFDKWLPHNCKQVPRTAELLRQVPRISTAMFSIIDGGKHIPPHYGFFKSVLRYHLALMVPADSEVYIVVNGEKYYWKEGDDVLFDDTFLHEVWNNSDQRRVVLFCDVLRDRTLPPFFRWINRAMFAILQKSGKLKRAAKRAEVAKEIE